jgi:DNA-binding NarL/FixJ family response regulator
MIRVVIADDHTIVRQGLRSLLMASGGVEVVGEAADGREALAAVERAHPAVLLLDLSMPGLNGVEALRRVKEVSPRTRVLVLSMHAGQDYVRPAVRAGAAGYLVKGAGLDRLLEALRAVAGGGTFYGPEAQAVLDATVPGADVADSLELLTAREREVLQLVAEGKSNREIGEALGISPKTADAHRTNVMRKLDLHDAQALTRYALARGLVSFG